MALTKCAQCGEMGSADSGRRIWREKRLRVKDLNGMEFSASQVPQVITTLTLISCNSND